MSIIANQTGSFNTPSTHGHFRTEPHQSSLFIDSDSRDKSNSVSISDASYKSELILSSEVYQLGLSRIHMKYNIPTINERNALIKFFSSASGLEYIVAINDGLETFHTPATLMTAIINALNTETANSGLTFTATLAPNTTFVFDIISTGGEFQFLSSSHVDRGLPCSGIRPMSTPSPVQRVIAKCFYTSFVDIVIPSLKEGQTRINSFASTTKFSNSGHIHRQHVNIFFEAYNDITIDEEIYNISYNKVRQRNLNELSVRMYDEFGDIIYNAGDLPYLSYSMTVKCLS